MSDANLKSPGSSSKGDDSTALSMPQSLPSKNARRRYQVTFSAANWKSLEKERGMAEVLKLASGVAVEDKKVLYARLDPPRCPSVWTKFGGGKLFSNVGDWQCTDDVKTFADNNGFIYKDGTSEQELKKSRKKESVEKMDKQEMRELITEVLKDMLKGQTEVVGKKRRFVELEDGHDKEPRLTKVQVLESPAKGPKKLPQKMGADVSRYLKEGKKLDEIKELLLRSSTYKPETVAYIFTNLLDELQELAKKEAKVRKAPKGT